MTTMILAILQARTSSTRLPNKVLKPIIGKPMLLRQVERIKRSRLIDKLIVATSNDESDNSIELLCRQNDLLCFRGSLNDVLDRFYNAAKPFEPDYIVRLTGDCPLADPELIDKVITFHIEGKFDYTSNALEPTFPDGLDVEVFYFSCLTKAYEEACLPSQREHVTPFISQQPELFNLGSYKNQDGDYSHLRWTVDEKEDFELVTRIYEALYPDNPEFTYRDIMDYIDRHTELKNFNTQYMRNDGMQKSLGEDALFVNSEKGDNDV
jgi:spore coat polysaccharide biosynthesis protein SpsF